MERKRSLKYSMFINYLIKKMIYFEITIFFQSF